MPYLNWRDTSVTKETAPHPRLTSQLTLGLVAEQAAELAAALEPLFAHGPNSVGQELRVDLPEGWLMFWKLREGTSRLLLAHPAPEEWVVTAALDASQATPFLAALLALTPATPLTLSDFGKPGYPSNVEVVIRLRE